MKTLGSCLYHYTYDDIRDHLETVNRFSTITAQEKRRHGDRFRMSDILFRPPCRFLKAYFLKRGLMDGMQGFIIAAVSAYGVFMKYAKLWELEFQLGPPRAEKKQDGA